MTFRRRPNSNSERLAPSRDLGYQPPFSRKERRYSYRWLVVYMDVTVYASLRRGQHPPSFNVRRVLLILCLFSWPEFGGRFFLAAWSARTKWLPVTLQLAPEFLFAVSSCSLCRGTRSTYRYHPHLPDFRRPVQIPLQETGDKRHHAKVASRGRKRRSWWPGNESEAPDTCRIST